jgi:hypothetical protein
MDNSKAGPEIEWLKTIWKLYHFTLGHKLIIQNPNYSDRPISGPFCLETDFDVRTTIW